MIGDNTARITLLLDQVREHLDHDDPMLLEFVRMWWSRIPEEDLLQRSAETDAAASIESWRAFRNRDPRAIEVIVSNPHAARDGWQSRHTVVRVMTPDMPFVTDSVLMALSHDGLITHHIGNVVLSTRRNPAGELEALSDVRDWPQREVFIFAEIDRLPETGLTELRERLLHALGDVEAAVSDFDAMKARLTDLIDGLRREPPPVPEEERQESLAFLEWLTRNNFTFLGYRSFEYRDGMIRQLPDSALGTLRNRPPATARALADQPEKTRAFLLAPALLAFSQSGTRSRVHRPAYPDYIGIRTFDAAGRVIGEAGFLGLYTSRVYLEPPERIPMVRTKVARVLDRSGLDPNGFDGKVLHQVLATYPKDELFQISADELLRTAMGITYIHERRRTRLFVRHDRYGLFVHCLIYLPRDLYSTQARIRIQEILVEAYDAIDAEFEPYFSESILVRLQLNLRVRPQRGAAAGGPATGHGAGVEPASRAREQALEARLIEVTRDWFADLQRELVERFGEARSRQMGRDYQFAFPSAYRERYGTATAAHDIDLIEQLTSESPLICYFYRRPEESGYGLHLKIFHLGAPLPLSDVMATLENLGLRVCAEHPYPIRRAAQPEVSMLDFDLTYPETLDLQRIGDRFTTAFVQIWNRASDDDRFNRLLLAADLDWRQVNVLRSYARYLKQIRFGFSEEFISNTLCRHHRIALALVHYFEARFRPPESAFFDDPDGAPDPDRMSDPDTTSGPDDRSEPSADALRGAILKALDDVALLNEDRILRRYLELIDATQRVNHFRTDPASGRHRTFLSLKLAPRLISEMPRPVPEFEIFVTSPTLEGVHLRSGPIARGGLRWSDRAEDYRTEVLGLMKAQTVKNAVIVPTGAKGGFIVRHPAEDPAVFREQGTQCYQDFIRGLLDLTDNVVNGELRHPPAVRCHDADDPYLVVAADKGTARFSDTANAVAADYEFWLGDAFASGGSNGYDHKQMGITARGAWISVQRHFAERDVDVQSDPVTVLGIGDMSGDVFGNGMLQSRSIRLVAAFNHLHVFLDPDPDPEAAFAERQRLFDLPRSTWMDYDATLISAGGGVFPRTAKSIALSAEIRERFAIDAERLAPDELIRRLLQAPVDLIWNGGIGTYVKAAAESHAEVGDRANDALRVNAEALRCRVIGEGGNLGLTQSARVAFARAGGAVNTDFIDNSAGVDCSDHEVNIKIALNQLVTDGELTGKHRNVLLKEMTGEVAALVLDNNFRQAQLLSLAERHVRTHQTEYRRFITLMEQTEHLDRQLESLPSDEQIAERGDNGSSLTRPELAVLMAFAKTHVKNALNRARIERDPAVGDAVFQPFPDRLVQRFPAAIGSHRLAHEIVSTELANDVVHHMGVTFVTHLIEYTGATVDEILRAYLAAAACFRIRERYRRIETLPCLDATTRLDALAEQVRLGRRATRWLLRHERSRLDVTGLITRYQSAIDTLSEDPEPLLGDSDRDARQLRAERFIARGVAADLALELAGAADLANALTVVSAAESCAAQPQALVRLFGTLGRALNLEWLLLRINQLVPVSHWQIMERNSLIDDMVREQGRLAALIFRQQYTDVDAWIAANPLLMESWNRAIDDARHATTPDFSLYAITCRKLIDLGKGAASAAPEASATPEGAAQRA